MSKLRERKKFKQSKNTCERREQAPHRVLKIILLLLGLTLIVVVKMILLHFSPNPSNEIMMTIEQIIFPRMNLFKLIDFQSTKSCFIRF